MKPKVDLAEKTQRDNCCCNAQFASLTIAI